MEARLKDRIAIVTGSDSGIGQAIAIEFARQGARVAITYLKDAKGAARTAEQCRHSEGPPLVLQVDVREPAQVARLFREVRDKLGVANVLVNNAGIAGPEKPLEELTPEAFDEVLKTNLYGAFHCCREFVRLRRAAGGGGRIINVTSVHEDIPWKGGVAYCAAKGGLRNLTRCLALEVADARINVNNLAPGMVLTPMTQEALDDPKVRKRETDPIPWKRAAEPWEMAKLALYLASDDADYATGQTFFLDGGLMMNWGQIS